MSNNTSEPVFEVEDLKKHYKLTKGFLRNTVGVAKAVDGISFSVYPGETFGIVGESGCGKSTAATSMLRLEEPTSGNVRFQGEDITTYNTGELRKLRRDVQMVFQDPESSFNPRMSVGDSVAEPLRAQGYTDRKKQAEIVGDLLQRVGLDQSDRHRYPHEFSGGQKQRIALARALSVNPSVLVADEPVSALDVSIQSEILQLIQDFQDDTGLAVIVISHNLNVVRDVCDRVAVMYLGEFVEVAPTEELFNNPKHPYTQSLLESIPTPDPDHRGADTTLIGDVPDPSDPPSGCRFHPRCPKVIPPEDIDVEQETWRNIMHFRTQLQEDSVDIEAIEKINTDGGELITANQGMQTDAENGVTDKEKREWVRNYYNIPNRVQDPHVEDVLTEAIEAVVTGDTDTAAELLIESFTTVCEREQPVLEDVREEHSVACHLHTD